MWLDDEALAQARATYGDPRILPIGIEISREERDLVVASATRRGRHHDVTLFVFNGDRLALIRKPHYGPGLWRTPGGGVTPSEAFDEGVAREALEELGVEVELRRYLVRTEAVFTHGGETIPWRTHVFEATTRAEELSPRDVEEISAARWGSLPELQGPIRELLLGTGKALWRYRVALHDATAAAIRSP
jgi:8-oxo-dGTP pyrophosphatase MutT (NUDIX family)